MMYAVVQLYNRGLSHPEVPKGLIIITINPMTVIDIRTIKIIMKIWLKIQVLRWRPS